LPDLAQQIAQAITSRSSASSSSRTSRFRRTQPTTSPRSGYWRCGSSSTGAAAGDLPGHTHTASDIVSRELSHKVQKDGADVGTRRALNLVQGTRVTLAAADDPANDRVSVTISAGPPEAGEITNALGYIPAIRAGEHFTGHIDCGPHQTIGGPLENMAKHSENFAAAAWDKNGGSCSVTSNAIIAPDGKQTADVITAVTDTPVIQQQIAGLATGPTVIAAPDNATSPLKIHGPGSNLSDSTLLELTAQGELILSGGAGNGYRLAELGAVDNPSGWAGVLKVKTPAGTTLGYILLYTNP
jgi:hypothetical protein